ncbi:hypothetical protein GCM10012288_20080 [Malaciobacter pacificus]|uniref:histidine kinase n=1 Tax=Malaciobacter pacificus TaxID=1080223 RepID=A0A5C2H5M2_9BACT|nr:PAS domain-containing sensor histidine kinase [Malaciobacter pacificus]QEP34270.1 PAS sensor-containing two-component system histidine kinase [Malaciobacter pacificus]GGD45739.1 hypothetical protein GCM10012288_20080 [Malaciobacter pacificus]
MKEEHYLRKELYEKINKDSTIFDFLEKNSLDGVWYWDLENSENEWMSPRFWEVLGYEANEKEHLVSQWQELIFDEDLEKATKNYKKHYVDMTHPYDHVVRYRHKKGHTVWIRCRGNILRNKDGKPIRMIGIHNDITQQKIAEEDLIKKNNELKAILDSSLSGIMAFDPFYDEKGEIVDFIFTMMNKEACKIVKLKEEEIINQRLSKIISGNFKPLDSLNGQTLFENYKEVVLTGKSKKLEFYFESDGIKEWFRNKVVKNNDGFVCTFEVITQEKELQQKLEQKVKEEVEKQRDQEKILLQQSKMAAMGEMIGAIAHNWRQPLNTLSLQCIDLINQFENSNLNKNYLTKWIQRIDKQLTFMSNTIDDFRNFYKPKEEFKKINLKDTILKIVSLIKYELNSNGIKVKIDISDSIFLVCLENQLHQSIINILLNAKDAILLNNMENKEIEICATKNSISTVLTIEDSGGGIKDSDILKRIFELYFTTKQNSNGTGVGLYMTKIIIEQNLNGKIEVENINKGLRFKIEIPH